jgi:glycine oxidase ThiO
VKITVVGAGIIGCAVAHELASRGAHVQVIDMRGVGRGATQASAGMLAPYIEGHHESLRRLGVRSLEMYDGFIARVAGESNQSIEFDRCGTLQVATCETEMMELALTARRLAHEDVIHELMPGIHARRLEPLLSPQVQSALVVPEHGYVRAAELMSALTVAAVSRGAEILTRTVEDICASKGLIAVRTNAGLIESDALVIAAGSWASKLPSAPPVRPVRGQLVHLQFDQRPLSRIVWGANCYLVPWRSGALLVGATVEDAGFDETATAAGVGHLLNRCNDLLTTAGSARFEGVRVGLRPGTPDELPLIGPSSTMRGVYYATGHYRNGVLLAPLTARLVADLVIDDRRAPDLDLVRPDRFGM